MLAVVFSLSLVGTGVMWFTDLYLDSILNQMVLREGTEVYEAWRKPPVKPLICIKVFNYTNIPEYAKGIDDKIKLQEVGPYCYRETLEKRNITFNGDGTVTYGDTRTHEFEPQHSNGTKDDILIVPNMPLIAAVALSKNINIFMRTSISLTLRKGFKYSSTMVTVKAHEFFFGYDDKMIEGITKVSNLLLQKIPFEKFGILAQRAAITDDTITVKTGTADLDEIGVVSMVNDMEELDSWPEPECNRIDGSDGAFFPRSTLNETATVYLFHKDMCRRMPFVYDKEVDFQDGVMGMRFHAPPNAYDTQGTCYCAEEGCSPKGVFDLSPCSHGIPLMTSFPHFLYGDPKLREPFEGLKPDPKKHEFYIDVQRILGFTLGTVSRLQLNIKVHKVRGMNFLRELPQGIILPVVWLQVSAEKMPPGLFNYIYHATFTVRRIQVALQWITLSSTLITGYLIFLWVRKSSSDKKKPGDEITQREVIPLATKV